jgi:hypothetical protein
MMPCWLSSWCADHALIPSMLGFGGDNEHHAHASQAAHELPSPPCALCVACRRRSWKLPRTCSAVARTHPLWLLPYRQRAVLWLPWLLSHKICRLQLLHPLARCTWAGCHWRGCSWSSAILNHQRNCRHHHPLLSLHRKLLVQLLTWLSAAGSSAHDPRSMQR